MYAPVQTLTENLYEMRSGKDSGEGHKQRPHVFDVVLAHSLYQVHSADEVVGVVQHGVLHALADGLPSSEVNHGIKPAAARFRSFRL